MTVINTHLKQLKFVFEFIVNLPSFIPILYSIMRHIGLSISSFKAVEIQIVQFRGFVEWCVMSKDHTQSAVLYAKTLYFHFRWCEVVGRGTRVGRTYIYL